MIRLPAVQQKIVNYATSYVSERTGTTVDIQRLYIGFNGNILLEGLYLDTPAGDTLIALQHLEVGIAVKTLFKSEIHLSDIELNGLIARIEVDAEGKGNYQFLIEAFASGEENTTEVKNDTAPGETQSKSVRIDHLSFCNSNVSYNDHFTCMFITMDVGCIEVNPETLDFNDMNLQLGHIQINDLTAGIRMCEGAVADTTSGEPIPLVLGWDRFDIDNLKLLYTDEIQDQKFDISLPLLASRTFQLDLGKQKIAADKFKIEDLTASFYLASPANEIPSPPLQQDSVTLEELAIHIGWDANINSLELLNSNISYAVNKNVPRQGKFDPEHLELKALDFIIKDLKVEEDEVTVKVENISFRERSGFTISVFTTLLFFGKEKAFLKDLVFKTSNSEIAGDFTLSYLQPGQFMSVPSESKIRIQLPSVKLHWNDAKYFTDEDIPHSLTLSPFVATASIEGTLADLNIKDLKFRQAGNFSGRVQGHVLHPTQTDQMVMDLTLKDTRIYTRFIREFMNNTEGDNLNWEDIPPYSDIVADFKGSTEKFKSNFSIYAGSGYLKAFMELDKSEAYSGSLVVSGLEAGAITGMANLGQTSLHMTFKGKHFDLDKVIAEADLTIDSVDYNNYSYENINARIGLKDKSANFRLTSTDPFLDFTMEGNALLGEDIKAGLKFDLQNINPGALNLIEEDYTLTGKINIDLLMKDSTEINVDLAMEGIYFFANSERYPLGSSAFSYHQTQSNMKLSGKTGFMDLDFESNLSSDQTIELVKRQLSNYIGELDLSTPDSLLNKGYVMLEFSLTPDDIITEVFLTNIEEIYPFFVTLELDGGNNIIDFSLNSERLVYSGMEFDSINLVARGNTDNLSYDFHLDKFKISDLTFFDPSLKGSYENNKLLSTFSVRDEKGELSNSLSFGIETQDSIALFHLVHDEFFINYEYWKIDTDNKVIIGPDFLQAEAFRIVYNETFIEVQTGFEARYDNVRLVVEDINLGRLAGAFLADSINADGRFNADIFIDKIFENPTFKIDAGIEKLKYENYNFGDLTIQMTPADKTDTYLTAIRLSGESRFNIDGNLVLSEVISFRQKFNLEKVDMAMIEKFSDGALTDSKGLLSGVFEISGNTEDYQIAGNIDFNGITFTPVSLGRPFLLENERISFTQNGISFKSFTIKDFQKNTAVLNGQILTSDYSDIRFDLSLDAKNFRALDMEEIKGVPYYGQLVFSAETTIRGDINLPVIRGRLKIENATSLTVVVPEQSADIIDRDNVVIFVDETSLRLREAEKRDSAAKSISSYSGIDLIAVLETSPEAAFRVIIDPVAGDYLDIRGNSNLNLTINQAGDMSLTGRYDIKSGAYQISMYDVIRKRFEISENSYIMWQGDPMKAEMDITAVHTVRTDALDLLADQLIGADESKKTTYRQEIPYLVNMRIKGSIEAPEISFFLDLPDNQKGVHGGVVYSRLQQLNQQESEVNKQAFALIVLGRFLSDAPSASSGGGEALARNSASRLLTQQLNNLAGKYIKGVDLNFNLDSYNDYSSGSEQGRTQLNVEVKKTLFSDRLILQVGSNIDLEGEENRTHQGSSELVGDLIAEYLVSEDGRYRLKAFRKNEFEGMIDGQLINSGLSFVFVRETEGQGVRRKRKALEAIKKEEDAESTNDE